MVYPYTIGIEVTYPNFSTIYLFITGDNWYLKVQNIIITVISG